MITALRKLFSPIKPLLEFIARIECAITRRANYLAHLHLFWIQWGIIPVPEFFEHKLDQFYNWERSRNPQWVERGVYSNLVLRKKRVLELCCGDGFNAKFFYSILSESIVACDFDPKAIRIAKRNHSVPNVRFLVADIRTQMPEGTFENIIWDAAIEHFTLDETAHILTNIKSRLTPDGILSGHTIVDWGTGKKHLVHHEYEFKGKDDLALILKPYFQHISVFETTYPTRHNLYFYASEEPLSSAWPSGTHA